jgi:hypothetical protein
MAIQFNQNPSLTHDPTITLDRAHDSFDSPTLPEEIWSHVFSFLFQDPQLRGIVAACMLVNQEFLQICIKQVSSQKMLSAFHLLPAPGAPPNVIPLSLELTPNHLPKCLAIGEDGIGYYKCFAIDQHILYIIKSTSIGCKLFSLDLQKEIVQTKEQNPQGAQHIVSCHPRPNGFIVVTRSGCSVWEYDKAGKPVLHSFHNLNLFVPCNSVYSTSYYNGVLLVTHGRVLNKNEDNNNNNENKKHHIVLKMIDLNAATPQFSEVYLDCDRMAITPKDKYKLSNIGKEHLILCDQGQLRKLCPISVRETGGKKFIIPEGNFSILAGEFSDGNFDFNLSKWPYFVLVTYNHTATLLYVHNIKENKLWIAPEKLLHVHCAPYVFVEDYFLFLSYFGKNFQIIHLPTKKDYTEKLKPFLEPYLNKNTRLFSAKTRSEDRDKGFSIFLDVLLLDSENGHLSKVAIPLTSLRQLTKATKI